MPSKLIIICGLPGSGKTTLAKKLETELQALRFCPHEWMEALEVNLYNEEKRAQIEALQWKLGQQLLKLGQTIIFEWGTWGRSERDALRLGAKALGASVELHYLHAEADILFQRVQKRGRENPPLSREDVENRVASFQVPGPEEMALFDRAVEIR